MRRTSTASLGLRPLILLALAAAGACGRDDVGTNPFDYSTMKDFVVGAAANAVGTDGQFEIENLQLRQYLMESLVRDVQGTLGESGGPPASKAVVDGVLSITKYEGNGFKLHLPERLRQLKRFRVAIVVKPEAPSLDDAAVTPKATRDPSRDHRQRHERS